VLCKEHCRICHTDIIDIDAFATLCIRLLQTVQAFAFSQRADGTKIAKLNGYG
jgi:hypothetical protein